MKLKAQNKTEMQKELQALSLMHPDKWVYGYTDFGMASARIVNRSTQVDLRSDME